MNSLCFISEADERKFFRNEKAENERKRWETYKNCCTGIIIRFWMIVITPKGLLNWTIYDDE